MVRKYLTKLPPEVLAAQHASKIRVANAVADKAEAEAAGAKSDLQLKDAVLNQYINSQSSLPQLAQEAHETDRPEKAQEKSIKDMEETHKKIASNDNIFIVDKATGKVSTIKDFSQIALNRGQSQKIVFFVVEETSKIEAEERLKNSPTLVDKLKTVGKVAAAGTSISTAVEYARQTVEESRKKGGPSENSLSSSSNDDTSSPSLEETSSALKIGQNSKIGLTLGGQPVSEVSDTKPLTGTQEGLESAIESEFPNCSIS